MNLILDIGCQSLYIINVMIDTNQTDKTMKSVKEFMNSDPSAKELLEHQIEQIESKWMKYAIIRKNEILSQIDELIDEDNNITDELAYDKLEYLRGEIIGRIDTYQNMIGSLKNRLKYLI